VLPLAEMVPCPTCAAPVRAVSPLAIARCPQCGARQMLASERLPAVALAVGVDAAAAVRNAAAFWRGRPVARDFIRRVSIGAPRLVYVPAIESICTWAGYLGPTHQWTVCRTRSLEEKWLAALPDLGAVNLQAIEQIIATAPSQDADPATLRRQGTVLDMPDLVQFPAPLPDDPALELKEQYRRLVYVPLWELQCCYGGVVFMQYLAATDGQPLTLRALSARKSRMMAGLAGFAGIGLLAPQAGKVAALFGMLLFGLLSWGIIAGLLGLCALLVPFFWALLTEQHMLVRTSVFQDIVPLPGDHLHLPPWRKGP
jgi:hypothetical protein